MTVGETVSVGIRSGGVQMCVPDEVGVASYNLWSYCNRLMTDNTS